MNKNVKTKCQFIDTPKEFANYALYMRTMNLNKMKASYNNVSSL